jgi:hypothetical protein
MKMQKRAVDNHNMFIVQARDRINTSSPNGKAYIKRINLGCENVTYIYFPIFKKLH